MCSATKMPIEKEAMYLNDAIIANIATVSSAVHEP